MRRARGFIDLIFGVIEETSGLVQRTQDEIDARLVQRTSSVPPVREAVEAVTEIRRAISGMTFQSIRAISGITHTAVNLAAQVAEVGGREAAGGKDIDLSSPMLSSEIKSARWFVDHLESSINGFWGHYLARKSSRLDLGMTLRHPTSARSGQRLGVTAQELSRAYPNATNKICVFVHGFLVTEWIWCYSSHAHYGDPEVTFGSRLHKDLGYTPLYVRYNTGRHVSENGQALSDLLTEVVRSYPAAIDSIALVGHSAGGLVVRSAAHYGHKTQEPWIDKLHHVACVASPHLGAPLEKAANLVAGVLKHVPAAGARVPAEILDSRSDGAKDLRFGYTVDEEWMGRDPDAILADARRDIPLVEGVGYSFLAATIAKREGEVAGELLGDLVVRLPSAKGEAPEPARRIPFASGAVFQEMNHADIANHPDVYEALRGFFDV